jgi:hypothetical protein
MPTYPAPLQSLLEKLSGSIKDLMGQLESGSIQIEDWQAGMQELLATYHLAAYMAGIDSETLNQAAIDAILPELANQFGYLDNFRMVIESAAEFDPAFYSRADMYAGSIVTEYWEGATQDLPLPAQPGQGTQCLSNCRCGWRIEEVDAANGDFDAYWELEESTEDHCQTCQQRHDDWYPVQIRNWNLI